MIRVARPADLWSGLALAALGACILLEARSWVYLNEDGPGPGFLPLWYGGAILALSLRLVAGAVGKTAPAFTAVDWRGIRRALACWTAFAASVVLMKVAGFEIAYALLTWFVVGVMPGLGPSATIAMLLPLTFKLEPAGAMIMLAGIYYGAKYGGQIEAQLREAYTQAGIQVVR